MKTDTPQTVYLKDYTPPTYLIDRVELDFDIRADGTTVTSTLAVRRNPATAPSTLILDGEDLETLSVTVDGQPVTYTETPTSLSLGDLPADLLRRIRAQPERFQALVDRVVVRTVVFLMRLDDAVRAPLTDHHHDLLVAKLGAARLRQVVGNAVLALVSLLLLLLTRLLLLL